MNRDDIIRMSDESGLLPTNWGATENQWRSLERFAALVAAAEREECIEACKSDGWTVAAYIIRARGQS
jgi:hypothetical protein